MIVDLLKELNALDEHPSLEAKACRGNELGVSLFETVCAFANEPGLGGGRVVLGVARRDLTTSEVFSASNDLRGLRDLKLLEPKGKGSATYYVPGRAFPSAEHTSLSAEHASLSAEHTSLPAGHASLPPELSKKNATLGARPPADELRAVISSLCRIGPLSATQLCAILDRKGVDRLKRDHLTPMREGGLLDYLYTDMERHPKQAYIVPDARP